MICFPNAKINLGLNILEKRSDGFHNIESIFYPIIGLKDGLEVIENREENEDVFHSYGIEIPGKAEDNLCLKALRLIRQKREVPFLKIYLQKHIPIGAGLGGGSADASFFIKLLNDKFNLEFTLDEMLEIASQLGSDCAFFIKNEAALATQRGEILKPISLDLSDYVFVLIFSDFHISTKDAYQGITPMWADESLTMLIKEPISSWKHKVKNDFESTVFTIYPSLKDTKEWLYQNGAIYASMTGTGSTVYGIFNRPMMIESTLKKSKFEKYYIS